MKPAVSILDSFHVLERVRGVSKVVHPQDKSLREARGTKQTRDLLNGEVETVIRRWRRLQRQAEKARSWTLQSLKTVPSAITYSTNSRHRICYDEYLSRGYPIGSGVAEGACRNLVKNRLDCTGMHWRLAGARAMLKTRALYLTGEWDDFVEFRIQ